MRRWTKVIVEPKLLRNSVHLVSFSLLFRWNHRGLTLSIFYQLLAAVGENSSRFYSLFSNLIQQNSSLFTSQSHEFSIIEPRIRNWMKKLRIKREEQRERNQDLSRIELKERTSRNAEHTYTQTRSVYLANHQLDLILTSLSVVIREKRRGGERRRGERKRERKRDSPPSLPFLFFVITIF